MGEDDLCQIAQEPAIKNVLSCSHEYTLRHASYGGHVIWSIMPYLNQSGLRQNLTWVWRLRQNLSIRIAYEGGLSF